VVCSIRLQPAVQWSSGMLLYDRSVVLVPAVSDDQIVARVEVFSTLLNFSPRPKNRSELWMRQLRKGSEVWPVRRKPSGAVTKSPATCSFRAP